MISIEKKINESVVNYGLVNNVLQYNGVSKLDAVSSNIEFNGQLLTVRPAPDGSFFYNLREFISSIMSANGFEDNVDIDVDVNGYVYDVTTFALLKGNIKVTTFLADNSEEIFYNSVYFLNSVKQKEDLNKRLPSNFTRDLIFPLAPLSNDSNRKIYLDYWEGFPFDITIHKGTGDTTTKFKNNDNLSEFEAETGLTEIVSRYVFSDGRTEIGLAQQFNMINGQNNITISSGAKSFEMIVNRIPLCKVGFYIKWINSEGGYSYFMFHKGERFRKTSDLGEIENDYYNLEDTVSASISIGKESVDEIRVSASCVEPERQNYLNDIIDSPAIFMFTGVPFNKNTYKDWLSIKLKTSSVKVENAKQRLNNYDLTFELPKRNTRKA